MITLTNNVAATIPDDFIGTPTITSNSYTVLAGDLLSTNGMLYVHAGGDHWEQLAENFTVTMGNPWGGCIKNKSDDKSWDGLEELL